MSENYRSHKDLSFIEAVKRFGTQIKASRALNIPQSTFSLRLKAEKIKAESLKPPASAIDAEPVTQEKPRIRVKAGSSTKTEGMTVEQPLGPDTPLYRPMYGTRSARQANVIFPVSEELLRITWIGDLHGAPKIEAECARCLSLIGEHLVLTKPQAVIVGGDFMDWISACQHEKNHTWRGQGKPTIREDMECCRRLLAVLKHYLDLAGIEVRVFTWGNHEDWLGSFENEHPEIHGEYTDELVAMFNMAGFRSFPYGEYVFAGGVAYTHVPKNKMDRPVGGQTAENTVAMQSTHDVVFGHTHVVGMGKRVKLGYRNAVTVLNGGSAMPVDYVGDYAQRTTGNYTDSGCLEVDAADGRIVGHAHQSMRKLEVLYGEKADAFLEGGVS